LLPILLSIGDVEREWKCTEAEHDWHGEAELLAMVSVDQG